jgi:HicB family
MDLTGYVDHLRGSLTDAAAAGGEAMEDAAARLATSLDAAVRMALLEALSDAAAEITAALDGTSVEVRLKGRDPDFVVTEPPADAMTDAEPPGGPFPDADDEDATTARITLRIPEGLKQRAEAAAAATRQSLNTWLVDAVRVAADGPPPPGRSSTRRVGKQLSGWAR